MTQEEYEAFVEMYDGLKAVVNGFKKLSRTNQFAVDFASLMAIRDTLKDFDSDETSTFILMSLMTNIAQAQYTVAEIIAKREESKE